MTNALSANFVDGSDAEFEYSFYDRRVQLSAYDEKTRRRYHLSFDKCTRVDVAYSQNVEDEFRDLNNLTEGIAEVESGEPEVRRFVVGFADETVVTIWCRRFSMVEAGN